MHSRKRNPALLRTLQVRADKLREVQAGHDGSWVAHPDLVKVRGLGAELS